MKSFLVYSGKGGVGKTTTCANIAKKFAEQGKKVFILDADVNTPSMGVIFKTEHPSENIWVQSTSFFSDRFVFMESTRVRSFFRECIKKIHEVQPDYVLIDTPPSITDVHINITKLLSVSAIIVVSQPNKLSVLDVNKTITFFSDSYTDVPVLLIENMCNDETDEPCTYTLPCIARIPFGGNFNTDDAYKKYSDIYGSIVTYLETQNLENVEFEIKKRIMLDDSITVDDIRYDTFKSSRDLKFINLQTWDYIRELIEDTDSQMWVTDRAISELTTERIKRLLEAFETDEEAYFLITKCPLTEIELLPGEIGRASLLINSSYYGVPKIKYKTKTGDVVLFPYEVMPATEEIIKKCVEDGCTITTDGRYIPDVEILEQIEYAFGSRVGLHPNWREVRERIISTTPLKENILKSINIFEEIVKNKKAKRNEYRSKCK